MQQTPFMLLGPLPERRVLPRMLLRQSDDAHRAVANSVNARVAANKIALISSLSLQFCIHNYLLFIISIHINTHTHTTQQSMQQLYVYLGYVVLAFVVMCYGLQLCNQHNGREGFALSPDSVSASAHPLLDYPLKSPGGLSNLSSDDLWSYYPVFDNGYAQYTNNVRYWTTPNNGKCSPLNFAARCTRISPLRRSASRPCLNPFR